MKYLLDGSCWEQKQARLVTARSWIEPPGEEAKELAIEKHHQVEWVQMIAINANFISTQCIICLKSPSRVLQQQKVLSYGQNKTFKMVSGCSR